jgi:hypothetical protein
VFNSGGVLLVLFVVALERQLADLRLAKKVVSFLRKTETRLRLSRLLEAIITNLFLPTKYIHSSFRSLFLVI